MKKNAYGYAVLALACLGMVPVAQAELEPISEQEMSEVQGQGFMSIENLDFAINHGGMLKSPKAAHGKL